jgi:NADPH:quinone reductase
VKALIANEYGPLDQLAFADLPTPECGPGEVLIRTQAVSVNPQDIRLVTGEARDVMPVRHPYVPGVEAASVVEAVGDGVTWFAPGDDVVAFTGYATGTFAEYVLLADGPGIAKRPPGLDATTGAALPAAALTAATVVEAAAVDAGRTLLIVGATGGVGCFAVQLASQAGARVLATAGPADDEYVRRLGAEHTIDYTGTDTAQSALRLCPGGVDVAIDLVNAGPALAATAAAVRPGGRVISPLGGPPAFDRDVAVTYAHVATLEGRLQDLAARAADGRLTVEVSATYPFTDAAKALADFVNHHVRGKIVVQL